MSLLPPKLEVKPRTKWVEKYYSSKYASKMAFNRVGIIYLFSPVPLIKKNKALSVTILTDWLRSYKKETQPALVCSQNLGKKAQEGKPWKILKKRVALEHYNT